jgi:hypothetical protein
MINECGAVGGMRIVRRAQKYSEKARLIAAFSITNFT